MQGGGKSLLCLVLVASGAASLPASPQPLQDGISPCPIGDEDLENCIESSLNTYIPVLAQGWENDIPSLDPLVIESAKTDYEDGNMTLSLILQDVVIEGFTSSRVLNVRAKSLEEGKFELMCKTPKITATGRYKSEGAVISFPLHSTGPFNVTLGDLTSHLVVHLESQNDHLQVSDIGLIVMPSLIDIQAAKTLDEDNHLGDTLNVYLNENSFELYNLIRPRLMDYFSKVIKTVANNMLMPYPQSKVFPNLRLKK